VKSLHQTSPDHRTSRLLLGLLGFGLGLYSFAQVGHSWARHATERTTLNHFALLPLAVGLFVLVGQRASRAAPACGIQTKRLAWAIWPLAAGALLSLWQWSEWRLREGTAEA